MTKKVLKMLLSVALLGWAIPTTGCDEDYEGYFGSGFGDWDYTDVVLGFDYWPSGGGGGYYDPGYYEEYEYYEEDSYYYDGGYGYDGGYWDDCYYGDCGWGWKAKQPGKNK